jgi:hypothetical protein
VNKRGTPVAHSGVTWLYVRTFMRRNFARIMRTSGDDGQAAGKLRLPIWVRVTSLTLTLALTATVALGVPLHSSERGCNLPDEMPGCEHMVPSAPGIAGIQLCCLLDCQEPGSTGSVTVQIPSLNLAPVHQVAPRPAFVLARPAAAQSWQQNPSFKPPDTYLKNRALLI